MTTAENSDGNRSRAWAGLKGKTLWDWLSLLVVPAVLATGAIVIEERFKQQQMDIEAARMREAATQEFVDRITQLVLDADLKGDSDDPKVAAARVVAQARTGLVLDQLDLAGRLRVFHFLTSMALVQQGEGCRARGLEAPKRRVVSLAGISLAADPGPNGKLETSEQRRLGKSDDTWAELARVCLNGADLSRSNLRGVRLSQWMQGAKLLKADLLGSELKFSDLSDAFLRAANLRGANLEKAKLIGADLIGADLRSAILTDTDLSGAKLYVADPAASTPYNSTENIDFKTGKNSGAIVQDVDFSKAKNLSDPQITYLCRNGATGLDCGDQEN